LAQVTVRYFASARSASGVAEESVTAATVGEVLAQITQRHGDRLAAILEASSLLLDGVQVRDPATALPSTGELDVLPPFAGG
jgi:sulfur-carrier protein